jgi:NADH:ubiquinone oxidoreductase subunit E
MHEPTFRKTAATVGLNQYMLEMANIREHCSWAHTDRAEATEKAKDLVRLMVEKVKRNHPLEEIKVPMTRRVMVIGAGIAGIQAALDVSAAGYEVVLVERKPSIGGHMSMLDETFPTLDCSQCILTPRMVEVMQSDKIKLYSYSEIEEVNGYIGNFDVKIRQKARSVDLDKCTGCGDCWNYCVCQHRIAVPPPTNYCEQLDPERARIVEGIIASYDSQAGKLIGILQDVQGKFNYLPEDVLKYVSERTGTPLSKIYGIAGFYGSFSLTPRGKFVVRVCMGTACHLKGAAKISDAISQELGIEHGETTRDGLFTLERVNCLGACALAPVVTINDRYHGQMTVAKMMGLIEGCAAEPAQQASEPAGVA